MMEPWTYYYDEDYNPIHDLAKIAAGEWAFKGEYIYDENGNWWFSFTRQFTLWAVPQQPDGTDGTLRYTFTNDEEE